MGSLLNANVLMDAGSLAEDDGVRVSGCLTFVPARTAEGIYTLTAAAYGN